MINTTPISSTAPSPTRIMEIGSSFWACRTLLTAVERGLYTLLSGRSMMAAALAAELGFKGRGALDFFDALVALGLLDRVGNGPESQYRNTPDTAAFLDRNSPTYLGGILEMYSKRLFGFWNDLGTALETGQAQNEVRYSGRSMFETLYADSKALEQFMSAMRAVTAASIEALSRTVDFSKYRTLCDVGGATGKLATTLAEANPQLQCLSFDLPDVAPIARKWVAQSAAADRVRVVSGNFLTDALPRADVITMSFILHDWGLVQKKHLIRLAYEALPPGGAFIAIDAVIDDARRTNSFGLLLSLNMLIEFGDGFDYTGAEFREWCREAGFSRCEVVMLDGPGNAAIAYK